jgi:CSLREA domain-containing protein
MGAMPRWVTRLGVLIATVVLAGASLTGCDLAVFFTVDSVVDAPDADPGDGVCASASGECTLRAAIMEANAFPDTITTTITLAPGGDYQLSLTGGDDDGAVGDLDVRSNVIIDGNGAIVQGTTATAVGYAGHRILEHHEGVLTMRNLTIGGGNLFPLGTPSADGLSGGGVMNHAELNLIDVSVRGNFTDRGGAGIHQTNGRTVLLRSSVRTNVGFTSSTFAGIFVEDGALLLFDSEVTSTTGRSLPVRFDPNRWPGTGIHQLAGSASITNSTIGDHQGFLIRCAGFPFVPPCTLEVLPGVGVSSDGGVDIVRTTFGRNVIDVSGTGAFRVSGTVLDSCDRPITSLGYNRGDGTCIEVGAVGDEVTAGGLAAFGDHGGPTQAFLPPAGASLVDAIPIGTPGLCDGSFPLTDQRQLPRPIGAGCDKGSVERQVTDA